MAQQIPEGAVWAEREGRRARGSEEKLSRWDGPVTDLTAILMMPNGKDVDESGVRLFEVIKAQGIDVDLVTMARFGELGAYIIGARSWEPDKPQIWIDRATFLPLRVILYDKKDKVFVETRYLEFGSQVGGNYFPRVVETYRKGALVRRSELVQIKTNQDLPETLFDVP